MSTRMPHVAYMDDVPTLYQFLQSERRKTRHWLHIPMLLVTFGAWLPFYVAFAANNHRHNQVIDAKMMGALAAMSERGVHHE